MLGGKMWANRKQYAASLWRPWYAPWGGVVQVATDVFGGWNSPNKFVVTMLDGTNGLMAWSPQSGTGTDGNGNPCNSTIYYRPFNLNGSPYNFGTTYTSSPGSIILNSSNTYLIGMTPTKALVCYSYGGGFAQYWSEFRLIQVNTASNVVDNLGNQATTSIAASRVNDVCRLSDTLAVAGMEGTGKLVVLVNTTGNTLQAFEATVGGGAVDSFYKVFRIDNTRFATWCNYAGTHYVKIYQVQYWIADAFEGTRAQINLISSYTMNRSNQGVKFLTPTRFVTYWQGGGGYYCADITVNPATSAMVEEASMATPMSAAPAPLGQHSFTLDGQAYAETQVSGGTQRQMRIVDFATDLWVGSWSNLNTVNADLNYTWGAVPIDSSKFLIHWTDAKYPTAAKAYLQLVYR